MKRSAQLTIPFDSVNPAHSWFKDMQQRARVFLAASGTKPGDIVPLAAIAGQTGTIRHGAKQYGKTKLRKFK